MKTLILAAGYGTRLYPLTFDIPKALLKIGDRLLIDFLIEKLKFSGIEDIAVITNEKFYSRFLEWRKGFPFAIDVINDNTSSADERLGAIGDVEFALERSSGIQDILVIGSDNLFNWDLKEFCRFCLDSTSPVVGLFDIGKDLSAKRFGVARLDSGNKIIEFQEKPDCPQTSLIGTCIYFFPEASIGFIREYASIHKDKDTTGQYIKWLIERTDVYGFVFKGSWFDIGHKESLEEARRLFS